MKRAHKTGWLVLLLIGMVILTSMPLYVFASETSVDVALTTDAEDATEESTSAETVSEEADVVVSESGETPGAVVEEPDAQPDADTGTEGAGAADDSGTSEDPGIPEETEEADEAGAASFVMTLPTVYLHINGGQTEVDAMNKSLDHSYLCTGTMDVLVPEGFRYVDSDAVLADMTGLGIGIRSMGNSVWRDPKNPYEIELNTAASLLGMGENRHWALIANAFDESLMRSRITYWLGKALGMPFTPSGYPVDVFLEGEYCGSYLLCETVRVDTDRVNIDTPDSSVTDGDALTGGYLLQHLQDPESLSGFSTRRGVALQNASPNFDPTNGGYENDAQKDYIRNFVDEAEYALYEQEIPDGNEPSGYRALNYRDYFDVDSAALYWLFQEFTMNGDAYANGNSYLYKTRDTAEAPGKISWGPLWGFDFAWDFHSDPEPREWEDPFWADMEWITAMMTDTGEGGLPDRIRQNWIPFREGLAAIIEEGGLLDQYYAEVLVSQSYDQETYQRSDDPAAYANAVETLRSWIARRIDWMDAHIEALNDYAYIVEYKADADDEHPQVFCYRNGRTPDPNVAAPEKEGRPFLGWFTEDGTPADQVRVESDLALIAAYSDEGDAPAETEPEPADEPEESEEIDLPAVSATLDRDLVYMRVGDVTTMDVLVSSESTAYEIYYSAERTGVLHVDASGMLFADAPGHAMANATVGYYDEEEGWVNRTLTCDVIVCEKEGQLIAENDTEGVLGSALNLEAIAPQILTEDDQRDMAGGADVRLWLQMTEMTEEETPEEDLEVLDAYLAANDLTLGVCYDLVPGKQVGAKVEDLHSLAAPLQFYVVIPEALRNSDNSSSRVFALLHVSGGEVSPVSSTGGNILVGESSTFSTYALVYRDRGSGSRPGGAGSQRPSSAGSDKAQARDAQQDPNRALADKARAGSASAVGVWIFLALASVTDLGWIVYSKKRKGWN